MLVLRKFICIGYLFVIKGSNMGEKYNFNLNLKHPLQLGCELAAALALELADHHLLAVVRGGPLVEQAPG